MDIKTPEKKFSNIIFGESSFNELRDYMKSTADDESFHLSLFLGYYDPDKKEAAKRIADDTGKSIEWIDFNDIVSKSETDTFVNLDRLFDRYNRNDSILYFTNGSKLCGSYTGFTHSKVKYATPQERHFLKKVQDYKGIVLIEITDYTDADQTIRRAAQSVVTFPPPNSPFRRFIWNLKNFSLHGYDIKTQRPEAYGKSTSELD